MTEQARPATEVPLRVDPVAVHESAEAAGRLAPGTQSKVTLANGPGEMATFWVTRPITI